MKKFLELLNECNETDILQEWRKYYDYRLELYNIVAPKGSQKRFLLEQELDNNLFSLLKEIKKQKINKYKFLKQKQEYIILVWNDPSMNDDILNEKMVFTIKIDELQKVINEDFTIWYSSPYYLEKYSLPIKRKEIANLYVVENYPKNINKIEYVTSILYNIARFGVTEKKAKNFRKEIRKSLSKIENNETTIPFKEFSKKLRENLSSNSNENLINNEETEELIDMEDLNDFLEIENEEDDDNRYEKINQSHKDLIQYIKDNCRL